MILVTGASGFIGKRLVTALIKAKGRENIVAFTSTAISGCHCLLHNNYTFNSDLFISSGYETIDTIIHAGAFIPKSGKDANNLEYCNGNITSTEKLLRSKLPCLKRIIFLSTVDVYGIGDPITENTIIEPVSLYGHSKFYCEKMIELWGKENAVATQVLRLGHVYGPGEEAFQKLIPLSFKKLINKKPLQIWGTGEEKRCFIFIDDVVKSILASTALTHTTGPINLVGTQVVSIRQLLEIIIKIAGVETAIEIIPTDSKNRNLVFDNSKMKELLLDSEISLLDGLSEEWKYFKSLLNEDIL